VSHKTSAGDVFEEDKRQGGEVLGG